MECNPSFAQFWTFLMFALWFVAIGANHLFLARQLRRLSNERRKAVNAMYRLHRLSLTKLKNLKRLAEHESETEH